jgi:hypothetical protein
MGLVRREEPGQFWLYETILGTGEDIQIPEADVRS